MLMNDILNINKLYFFWDNKNKFKLNVKKFNLKKNEKVLLFGKSGTGKSTFLNLISGLLKPNKGSILINSYDLKMFSSTEMDKFRAENIGVIFQQFYLLEYSSPLLNILLPCYFTNFKNKNYKYFRKRAIMLARRLNLNQELLLKKNSKYLSVGQKQRISILRAIINMPKIILADEPTSALDTNNRDLFLNLLFEICEKEKISLLMVSHDESLKNKFDRFVNIESF